MTNPDSPIVQHPHIVYTDSIEAGPANQVVEFANPGELDAYCDNPAYPDPTDSDLHSPAFEAVWGAIKGWDLSRGMPDGGHRMYCGATGNDVMHILKALREAGVLPAA